MKRFTRALIVVALAGLLGGCLSLKPFTQDELNRLSADGRPAALNAY